MFCRMVIGAMDMECNCKESMTTPLFPVAICHKPQFYLSCSGTSSDTYLFYWYRSWYCLFLLFLFGHRLWHYLFLLFLFGTGSGAICFYYFCLGTGSGTNHFYYCCLGTGSGTNHFYYSCLGTGSGTLFFTVFLLNNCFDHFQRFPG